MKCELEYSEYIKKLRGCFTGKAVGGTLGMPMEGYIGIKKITYYNPVPDTMIANDDLDLQVVWLEVIKSCGLPVNRRDLADGWLRHMRGLPDEYGVVIKNIKSGLFPPLSGCYDNKFGSGMGAAIRSEIWASLAPCDPALAVKLALEDCSCDHFGDGVDAELFLTAVESAAFGESRAEKLIETGLQYVTQGGRLDIMLRDTISLYAVLEDPIAVREQILKKYYVQNWTDVGINLSFIIAGWLDGERETSPTSKISQALCSTVGLGHDADCIGATLGSILGIIYPDKFERRWTEPLGGALVLSGCIAGMHEAGTVGEFCDEIASLCVEIQDYYDSAVRVTGSPAQIKKTPRFAINPDGIGLRDSNYNRYESLIAVRPYTIKLIYPKEIAIAPSETADFTAIISNPTGKAVSSKVRLSVPDSWRVVPDTFELIGSECKIDFKITAPARKERRVSYNGLFFDFSCDNISFRAEAGLIETYPLLHKACGWTEDGCPPSEIFGDADIIDSRAHYFNLEAGPQLFAFEVCTPKIVSEGIMLAQAPRPVKVWCDGKLILSHNGSECCPAFHRTENIARLSLCGNWQRFIIEVGDICGDYSTKQPHNAYARVKGCPSHLIQRKLYDASFGTETAKNDELFIGFAERAGYEWLHELEWRLPKY